MYEPNLPYTLPPTLPRAPTAGHPRTYTRRAEAAAGASSGVDPGPGEFSVRSAASAEGDDEAAFLCPGCTAELRQGDIFS